MYNDTGTAPGYIIRGGGGTAGVQGAEPLGGGEGAKPPEADALLVLKSWQKPSQSMYFLVKDDRKANFNNSCAWKYFMFSDFFLKPLGETVAPCHPNDAAPALTNLQKP